MPTISSARGSSFSDAQIRRLYELFRQLDEDEREYDRPLGLNQREPDVVGVSKWLRNTPSVITASDDKGTIVGMATNRPSSEYGDVGYIGGLVVDRKHRGQGIGRSLLRRALLENAAAGRKSMLRVSTNNKAGLRLYQSEGFVPASQTMVLSTVAKKSKE